MEESIYNLIPVEIKRPEKRPMYRSQVVLLPPTGSTFLNQSTANPGVNNVTGEHRLNRYGSETGFMGRPRQSITKLSPIKLMGTNDLKTWIEKGSVYRSQTQPNKMILKPLLPKDKPLMGIKTKKNYIATNAIEVILSNPKTTPVPEDWLHKQNYGTVPLYLSQIKEQLNEHYHQQQELQRSIVEGENNKRYDIYLLRLLMPDDEVIQLRENLKIKWNEVNQKYQNFAHLSKFDTIGLRRRKEMCEQQMNVLEKDIEKLNKQFVFVEK